MLKFRNVFILLFCFIVGGLFVSDAALARKKADITMDTVIARPSASEITLVKTEIDHVENVVTFKYEIGYTIPADVEAETPEIWQVVDRREVRVEIKEGTPAKRKEKAIEAMGLARILKDHAGVLNP